MPIKSADLYTEKPVELWATVESVVCFDLIDLRWIYVSASRYKSSRHTPPGLEIDLGVQTTLSSKIFRVINTLITMKHTDWTIQNNINMCTLCFINMEVCVWHGNPWYIMIAQVYSKNFAPECHNQRQEV